MAFFFFFFCVEDNLKSVHNCCNNFSVCWKSHYHLSAFQSNRKKGDMKSHQRVKISWRSGSNSVYLAIFYYKYLEEKCRENRMRSNSPYNLKKVQVQIVNDKISEWWPRKKSFTKACKKPWLKVIIFQPWTHAVILIIQ